MNGQKQNWTVQELTRSGMLAAGLLFFLLVGRLLPFGYKALGFLCMLAILVGIFLMGRWRAFILFLGTAVLSNIFAPSLLSILYVLCFGSYPFAKVWIDQRFSSWRTSLPIKLGYFAAAWFVSSLLFRFLVLGGNHFGTWSLLTGYYVPSLIRISSTVAFLIFMMVLDIAISFGSQPLYRWLQKNGFLQ